MVSLHENGEGTERRRRKGSANVKDSSNGTGDGDLESSRKRSEKIRKMLLGFGFWVQGLRCFPWLGVNFFLKDGLRMDPSSLQLLQNSANLPMVAKPFYGILSDSYYIFGQHRIPYIAIGASLQAFSWFALAFLPATSISFFTVTFYLLLSNLGASVVEVANDAIVAETSKQRISSSDKNSKSSSSGNLQSFVWMATAIGGVLGNLVGGLAIDKFPPQLIFSVFAIILTIQFLVTTSVHEKSLDLPKNTSSVGIRKQLAELLSALRKPEISYSIGWFAASYALIPALTGTMFYYQTEHLKIESSLLGMSKVIGQAAMLMWGIVYERNFKSIPPRKLIPSIQVTMAVFMLSDILFVKGIYKSMGIPDSAYVMVLSGILEILGFFKILPFTVIIAQLCPPGCEGSLMAFLMSSVALAMIVSGYLGVALASYVKVTGNDFSGLPTGLLIQAVCTLLPLYWSSYIPNGVKAETKTKEN